MHGRVSRRANPEAVACYTQVHRTSDDKKVRYDGVRQMALELGERIATHPGDSGMRLNLGFVNLADRNGIGLAAPLGTATFIFPVLPIV